MQAEEEERHQRDPNSSFVGSLNSRKVDDVKDIKQILVKTTLAGCDAAPIGHGLSTNTSEILDFPCAGWHCRRDRPIVYEGGNISRLHSRPRWDGKDINLQGGVELEQPSRQGPVEVLKFTNDQGKSIGPTTQTRA